MAALGALVALAVLGQGQGQGCTTHPTRDAEGLPCVFPFRSLQLDTPARLSPPALLRYREVTYTSCTTATADDRKPWCSTLTDRWRLYPPPPPAQGRGAREQRRPLGPLPGLLSGGR